MTNYEILQYGFTENHLTKQDIYDQVINGKITIEDHKNICGEEIQEIPLNIAKQLKKDELWAECNKTILEGFNANILGDEFFYGFDFQDQSNYTQTLIMIESGLCTEPIYWKSKGAEGQVLPYTFSQFKQLCQIAQVHKINNIGREWGLKAQVDACTTSQDVFLVNW